MNIILHLPTTAEARAPLARQVAQLHAELSLQMLRRLPGPAEDKLRLLDALIRSNPP